MKDYVFIFEDNFQRAREKIRKNSDKKIIFISQSDELNRKILEKEKISYLLINLNLRKDSLKQRDTGFNHVLAKIAKKSNIGIAINLDEIILSNSKEKAKIISRIIQNIKLCNKNKIKMKFFSLSGLERDSYDLKALGIVFGMPGWMTKDF